MNTLADAIILILVFVGVGLSGQFLVNRLVKHEVLEKHHSAGEAMMGVVGTLFSVLLGFMVASAMDKYHDAQMHGEQEANSVVNVFRIAGGFSAVDRPRLRKFCRQYIDEVINDEWPMMEKHQRINHGWKSYNKLWESAVAVAPENDRQSSLLQELVASMKEVGEHRRARILLSQKEMPVALWAVVGIGAIITLALSYVFASQFPKVQGFMTTLVASALALNIWLLAAYTHPYSGELKLRPAMFVLLKESISDVDDTKPSPFLHDASGVEQEQKNN